MNNNFNNNLTRSMINQRNITKSGFSRVNEVVSVAVVDDNEKIVRQFAMNCRRTMVLKL